MASSTELCLYFYQLQNKNATGAFAIPEFERLWNQVQKDKFMEWGPPTMDMSSQNRFSVFLTPRIISMTNGRGEYNPGGSISGDLATGPLLYTTGYVNQGCGNAPSTYPSIIPIPVLGAAEFLSRSGDITDRPTRRNPIAYLSNDINVEVLPPDITYIKSIYWRWPKDIAVGLNPAFQFPDLRPLEGAPNQVDPEWDEADCNEILYRCLQLSGVQLQSDRLFGLGKSLQTQQK